MGDYQPYEPRLLESTLQKRLRRSPVVVLSGPRQSGKTTLIQGFPGSSNRRYLTLDSLSELDRARREPEILAAGRGPLTIDEVQRAPELLLAIKRQVDLDRSNGRFLLTGSANLLLLRQVSEALAGRAVFLALRPMTEREKRGDRSGSPWGALLAAEDAEQALEALAESRPIDWRLAALEGGFPPAALTADADQRELWHQGYVDTYVKRDLRDLAQVADLVAFERLTRVASLRPGGLLNQADLARDAAVPPTTAQRWLALLETSFLFTRVPAFSGSRSKRLIKAPKLYPVDTGLALHLAGYRDPEELEQAPLLGAWLETLVLGDLLSLSLIHI